MGIRTTILFANGFEEGNLTAYDTIVGTPAAENTKVHTGNWGMGAPTVAGEQHYVSRSFAAQTIVYHRFFFLLTTNATIGQVSIARLETAGPVWKCYVGVNQTPNFIFFWTDGGVGTGTAVPDITVQTDRWYMLEEEVEIDHVNGKSRLWIDGILKVDNAGIVNDDTGNLINATVGNTYSEENIGTIYFDDQQVADQYNGSMEPAWLGITGTAKFG